MSDKVTKRDVLAQDIMDLYYQDFKDDNEGAFDIDFFIRQVNDTYSSLLREQYVNAYTILRQEGGQLVEMVRFDEQWLRKETVELKLDDETGLWTVKLKGEVFAFPYDTTSCGVQDVLSVKMNACNLVRSKESKTWIRKFQPETDITRWWTLPDSTIVFDKDCCKKVKVFYVPVPDGELELQEGLADTIKKAVLQLMIGAREGTIVDATNDSNPNKRSESETNKEQLQ